MFFRARERKYHEHILSCADGTLHAGVSHVLKRQIRSAAARTCGQTEKYTWSEMAKAEPAMTKTKMRPVSGASSCV